MPFFGKKKKEIKPESVQKVLTQNETSYFGKNLKIKGRVSGNGNIIIMGGFDGEFDLRGRVKIAQPAKIKGEIKADVISVNGHVQGKLAARQRLHLDQTARIEGQLTAPKLSIAEGASFDGEVTMSGRVHKPSKPQTVNTAKASQKQKVTETS
ncbi:MAG: polymer-forming cytoskeletal protein [Desulfobacterales bacterium]|nr:polymer-forming cytoskeletal protein [Desulfobacterales bacterium]